MRKPKLVLALAGVVLVLAAEGCKAISVVSSRANPEGTIKDAANRKR